MQHILMKIKLKPGSAPRLMEYVKEFDRRREECNACLREETADVETFFIEDETLYVFKRVKDIEQMRSFAKTSGHPLYGIVAKFTEDCLGERVDLEDILSFDL